MQMRRFLAAVAILPAPPELPGLPGGARGHRLPFCPAALRGYQYAARLFNKRSGTFYGISGTQGPELDPGSPRFEQVTPNC